MIDLTKGPKRNNQSNRKKNLIFFAKVLFMDKKARPYIHPMIFTPSTIVKYPNIGDRNKLKRLLRYLNDFRNEIF